MSTKIYDGFRCRLETLETVLVKMNNALFAGYVSGVSLSKCDEVCALRKDEACGIHVWIHDGWALMSLYGPNRARRRVTRRIKNLLPYAYWNNTDKDERVRRLEWDARGRVWGEVLAGDGWERRMTLRVVDEDGFTDSRLFDALIPRYKDAWSK